MRSAEQASSREAACLALRTDIELPGALRYLTRMVRDVHRALVAIKGLLPTQFIHPPTVIGFTPLIDSPTVLMALRELVSDYLALLPAPVGFNPRAFSTLPPLPAFQHRMGHDPPVAFIDASN